MPVSFFFVARELLGVQKRTSSTCHFSQLRLSSTSLIPLSIAFPIPFSNINNPLLFSLPIVPIPDIWASGKRDSGKSKLRNSWTWENLRASLWDIERERSEGVLKIEVVEEVDDADCRTTRCKGRKQMRNFVNEEREVEIEVPDLPFQNWVES